MSAGNTAPVLEATKHVGDALIDEKADIMLNEKAAEGLYTTTLSPAERELEKKLKRKIDARWLVLTLIYILNYSEYPDAPCSKVGDALN